MITLSSTTPIPVSSTACLARGILAWFAAIAAALKILSTFSCVYVENFFCASLTCASFASSASTESTILLSFTSVTKKDIIDEAKTFDSIPVDVVEWRVDWFEHVFEFDKVEEVLKELREALGNIPILMTFRTSKEGGEKAIEPEAYAELNIKAAQTGYVDFVDVEIFTGDEIVKKIIDGVHAAGVKVVASNHDFHKTPAKSDIIYRLRKMQDMGADIPKIAVMPQNKRDVLTLLAATEEMVTDYADRPVITMSMAGTGVISRLCGEVFGSSMTFGAAKKASAPGQMGVEDLSTVLGLLHKSM